MERDGAARPMSEPTIEQVNAAVKAVVAAGRIFQADEPGELFHGRLLGLKQAEQIGRKVCELRVGIGTVVTPLARDLLKKNQVSLRLVNEAQIAGGEWGFVIESQSGVSSAIRRHLMEGSQSWSEVGTTALDAALWVVAAPNRGASLLTSEASIAVWKANATPGVRAAFAFDLDSAARAIRHLGVNLLVIETHHSSISFLKHLLTTFQRAGSPIPFVARTVADENRASDRPSYSVERSYGPAERALRDRLAHATIGARPGLGGPG
jgi:hypothetical protein